MPGRNLLPSFPDRLVVAGLALTSVLALAAVNFTPRPAENVAVVFPPWLDGRDAVDRATAAGASLVRRGGFPFVLIVHPMDPAFAANAMGKGALFVLNAQAVAGCLPAVGKAS